MKIVHLVPTISRLAGGPAVSVRRLAQTLGSVMSEASQHVFSSDAAMSRDAAPEWSGVDLRLYDTMGTRRWHWAPRLRSNLMAFRPDLIHLHGLWQYHAYAAHCVARATGARLVVSPRGMLEPWALSRSRLIKFAATVLFQRALLQSATAVVVTSQLEAGGVSKAGVRRPLFVIPNGIDAVDPHQYAFGSMRPRGGPRTALFLSRIEPKKGVLELLDAWRVVTPAGWRLVIAGPSERGFGAVVERAISAQNLGSSVEMRGPVWGQAKRETLAEAELFVLPSFSENFGMAIGEAMAAGLPVITTQATPWRELESNRCGWWVPTGRDALVVALREAIASQPDQLAAMGRQGRDLIARRYGWQAVAQDMATLYRWATDPERSSMPHFTVAQPS